MLAYQYLCPPPLLRACRMDVGVGDGGRASSWLRGAPKVALENGVLENII